MLESAGSVRMLVYIDLALAVKKSAFDGRVRLDSVVLSAKESLKYEGCACAMGCSWRSTHLPSPCGRLLTSEHGRVGYRPLVGGLWTL